MPSPPKPKIAMTWTTKSYQATAKQRQETGDKKPGKKRGKRLAARISGAGSKLQEQAGQEASCKFKKPGDKKRQEQKDAASFL